MRYRPVQPKQKTLRLPDNPYRRMFTAQPTFDDLVRRSSPQQKSSKIKGSPSNEGELSRHSHG